MERYYLKSHEWVVVEGDIARVGISDHAQDSLGDIVFIELPKVNTSAVQGEEIAVIESMKAASPVNSPLSGTVAELNSSLVKSPEKINSDPHGEGWMFTLTGIIIDEIGSLMDEQTYQSFLSN